MSLFVFFLRSGELFDFENYKVCPQQDFHPIRPGGLLLSSVVEMIRQKKITNGKAPNKRKRAAVNKIWHSHPSSVSNGFKIWHFKTVLFDYLGPSFFFPMR